ncbi:chaperonin 10-like protein [Lipomyces tetrasporus]|uniref:Chaperonin 10-like protein n=1 Tax=Lipomyces tetrasporus TaxID=54092 RepID=A0AAD7QRL0_9ASCO|nr:chaperonin 10-like protein [Lipomyces tetrasporus]KAJ8100005.1 chaperonin 10-like protein [Lipomyces tetrasporus]
MKEVIVYGHPSIRSEIIDSQIPVPGPDEVLIKVVVSGSNPKDWKYPVWTKKPHNSGDDIAGIVETVGSNVIEFKKGDKVAAFHKMGKEHGSFAEYATAYSYTTFLVPESVSFEEAATIPLAALTAAYGLFDTLELPTPWKPAKVEIPLLVYGAATSVGAFAVKLAKLAGIGPIIGVAGSGVDYAKSIGNDYVVDYRNNDHIAEDIRSYLKPGQKLLYAWDTVSEQGSYIEAVKALEPGTQSKLSLILPGEYPELSADKVTFRITMVGAAHGDEPYQRDFAYMILRQISKWLSEGKFTGHPSVAVEHGLAGVGEALKDLNEGKVHASKYVFRVADTPNCTSAGY